MSHLLEPWKDETSETAETNMDAINEEVPEETTNVNAINKEIPEETTNMDAINKEFPEKGDEEIPSPNVPQDQGEQEHEEEQEPPDADEAPAGSNESPPRKKRVYLKNLTPNSKEVEIERRKQAKRDTSNRWHSKWESAGVPKACEEPNQDHQEEQPNEPHIEDQVNEQHQEPHDDGVDGARGDGDDQMAEPGGDDTFKPTAELLLDAPLCNDMRKVRFTFMKQWCEWKGTDDQKAAAQAWQESDLRAQIVAGRKKGQYWPRPKNGIFEDLVSVLHGINWARLKKHVLPLSVLVKETGTCSNIDMFFWISLWKDFHPFYMVLDPQHTPAGPCLREHLDLHQLP